MLGPGHGEPLERPSRTVLPKPPGSERRPGSLDESVFICMAAHRNTGRRSVAGDRVQHVTSEIMLNEKSNERGERAGGVRRPGPETLLCVSQTAMYGVLGKQNFAVCILIYRLCVYYRRNSVVP